MKLFLYKNILDVDIGFVVNKFFLDLKCKKKISEKDCYLVRVDIKIFFIVFVKKLLLKVLIRFGLVRNLVWLYFLEICCD